MRAGPLNPHWKMVRNEKWCRYLSNCETNLVVGLNALSLLFRRYINTTGYQMGWYDPSSPSTKELHGFVKVKWTLLSCTKGMVWLSLVMQVSLQWGTGCVNTKYGYGVTQQSFLGALNWRIHQILKRQILTLKTKLEVVLAAPLKFLTSATLSWVNILNGLEPNSFHEIWCKTISSTFLLKVIDIQWRPRTNRVYCLVTSLLSIIDSFCSWAYLYS